MITVKNYSGGVVSVTLSGRDYVLPVGESQIDGDGSLVLFYSDDFTGTTSTSTATPWGTLVVSDTTEFTGKQSPYDMLIVGGGLALTLFGVVVLLKIVNKIKGATHGYD